MRRNSDLWYSGFPPIRTTHNKQARLQVQFSSSDPRVDEDQTVFGDYPTSPYGHEGLSYVYSDRLEFHRASKARDAANESDAPERSCAWYEVFLSHYFEKKVEIEHIMVGRNKSTGFSYQIFGYKTVE